MIEFHATIKKFKEKGEKTAWSYIEISCELAGQLLPGHKKAFRVKGKLDQYHFNWIALIPMGKGSFILPLNASVRKEISKQAGDIVHVQMELDIDEKPLNADFMQCLEDEPTALEFFQSLPKGHQRYFSNWIESAKTYHTKAKRITQSVVALGMGLGYSEMIRMNKKNSVV